MSPETFLEKFDLIADAQGAVPKMRELILRLAMQGRLSEHHISDGPVSNLLTKIEEEKASLGIKKSRSEAHDRAENDDANEIPSRWAWVNFGELARHNAGKTLDKGRNRGELRDYITTSNLYWGFFQLDEVRKMPIEDDELERCTATKGDLLIVEGGEAGRAAVWNFDYEIAFQNHIHRARFFSGINPYFVQRYFEKLNATGEIEKYRKGVGISNMSGKSLASIPIPLPPLAEQKRIVAKVDELMALCDRLELQQNEQEAKHSALSRASLKRFSEAPTQENLEYLFHPNYTTTPADLRKTILTLAVQGKLVPQDPNEESAENSLALNDKTRRETAESDHRADKEKQPLLSGDDRWDIPDSWAWRGLADLVLFVDYRGKTPSKISSGVRLLTAKNVRKGVINLSPEEFLSESEYLSWMTRGFPHAGDILFTTEAPMGNAAIVTLNERFALAQRVICFQSYGAMDSDFLVLQILSERFQFILDKNGTGVTAKGIKASKLKQLPIAVPPLAEQKRIVAKVEELMKLVDQLEAQLTTARTTSENLLNALLADLTSQKAA